MSSARKRGAIQKANNKTDQLRQRLILSEHHASLFRGIAEGLAARCDKDLAVLSTIRKTLEVANTEPNGPICDTIWYTPHETLFDYIDAHLESYNVGAVRHAACAAQRQPAAARPRRATGYVKPPPPKPTPLASQGATGTKNGGVKLATLPLDDTSPVACHERPWWSADPLDLATAAESNFLSQMCRRPPWNVRKQLRFS